MQLVASSKPTVTTGLLSFCMLVAVVLWCGTVTLDAVLKQW